jgi:glycosyltransferase involved in cell wall biosynthesis
MDLVVLVRVFAPLLFAPGRCALSLTVAVVVPVYNGESTLSDCLRSLQAQNLPRSAYEVIVVDDGSSDRSATIAAEFGVRLVRQCNGGAAAARNAGLAAAQADWIAFTDADCVASRGWLKALLRAAAAGGDDVICVAGKTVGLASTTPAARFVDLSGGFDAGRHLSHPRYPFAPSGNVLYRRAALAAVGGYDRQYRSYEACDLHQRLGARGGRCVFEPAALVFHRHRATWRGYWRQQRSYGAGLGSLCASGAATSAGRSPTNCAPGAKSSPTARARRCPAAQTSHSFGAAPW